MLVQPLFAPAPVSTDPTKNPLTIDEFLALLREEEDYFEGEQHSTKLMISRLRKIFYDQWGWNSQLIRDAADIEMRYIVKIIDDPLPQTGPVSRYQGYEYQPKHRLTTYRPDDRIYGNSRVGQTPPILINDHQEVRLADGLYCDMGHVLAGLDALNNPAVVTPLHRWLSFLVPFFPHVNSNADVATWLTDIGSSAGDFLFDFKRTNKPLTEAQEQKHIDEDAPGSDMLGNIDAYVIKQFYDTAAEKGQRLTEILTDYYSAGNPYRAKRVFHFCTTIGLKDWNGERFSNENDWFKFYKKELRDDITFQVFSLTDEKLRSVWLPIQIWFGGYKNVLKIETLLQIWLITLNAAVKNELKTA